MFPGGAARDRPDVRRRQLVDAAEPELRDRPGGSRDRRASVLGMHPGVRGAAVERHLDRLRERRSEDHRSDRRCLVVDVALRARSRDRSNA